MTKLNPITILLPLITLLPPGPAAQTATPTYPGTMCQSLDGTALAIDSNAHLENPAAGTKTVLCPVVGDPLLGSASHDLFVTDQPQWNERDPRKRRARTSVGTRPRSLTT